MKGVKATATATGIGFIALAGGSIAYLYFRDDIIDMVCKR
jgi:hypothetical protein